MNPIIKALLEATGGTLVGAVLLYAFLRIYNEPLKWIFHVAATKEVEKFKVELQRQLETFKTELKRDADELQRRTELETSYRTHQHPVLKEATRYVVRISEIFSGRFRAHYSSEWNASEVDRITPERNKRDTAVYRLLRFWGAYHIYQSKALELAPHPLHGTFYWYVNKKITPVLASGNLPGKSVMWRDTIQETGESMVMYSEKWKQLRPIGWELFAEMLVSSEAPGPYLEDKANRLSAFLKEPSIRLALFSVYMIDLVQDTKKTDVWEQTRDQLLSYLKDHDDGSFSIYGKVKGDRNDVADIDLAGNKRPRNIRSVFYDRKHNPMNYHMKGVLQTAG